MKQEMMGWQWHQPDHTQIICMPLQTDNHASSSSLKFFTGQMLFLMPNQQCQSTKRSLRSSDSHQLVKPRHNLSFGSRAFRISAAHIWNSLPTNIREAQSLLIFRRHLKMHYFQ